VSTHRVREIYDRRAAGYDQSIGRGERWLLGDLRRAFGAELRGETLEVAIGSGLNLPAYSPSVTRAMGVDLSTGMLTVARQRARDLHRSIDLVQADAASLPFRDASFDTVAISLALCTVADPAGVLHELARVCRSGGRVVLLEHVRSPVWSVAAAQRLLSPLQERILGCHLHRQSINMAQNLGFTILSERRRLFSVVRLVVARPPAQRTA